MGSNRPPLRRNDGILFNREKSPPEAGLSGETLELRALLSFVAFSIVTVAN
jgi:hypothetical protein